MTVIHLCLIGHTFQVQNCYAAMCAFAMLPRVGLALTTQNLIDAQQHLYSLTATHPRFGISTIKTDITEKGIAITHTHLSLFSDRSDRKLLCEIKTKSISMAPGMSKTVRKSRISKRRMMKIPVFDQFEFANPLDIGTLLGPSSVFLSDLQGINEGNIISIYAKGLVVRENAFAAHPWYSGTGDHINSTHDCDISVQFVH